MNPNGKIRTNYLTDGQVKLLDVELKREPKIGRRKLQAKTGLPVSLLEEYLRCRRTGKTVPTIGAKGCPAVAPVPVATVASGPKAISVAAFVGKFDYAAKLRATIARLCKGNFVPDATVRSESEIPPVVFRTVAEQPEFKGCQVRHEGLTYWSTKENVDLVRKQAGQWGVQR